MNFENAPVKKTPDTALENQFPLGTKLTCDEFTRQGGPWQKLKDGETVWGQLVYNAENDKKEYDITRYGGEGNAKRNVFIQATKVGNELRAWILTGAMRRLYDKGWDSSEEVPWNGFRKAVDMHSTASLATDRLVNAKVWIKIVSDPTEKPYDKPKRVRKKKTPKDS